MIPKPRRFRRRGWIVLAAIVLTVVLAGSAGATISSLRTQGQPHYQSAVGTPVYLPTPTPVASSPTSGTGLLPPSPVIGPPGTGTPPRVPDTIGVIFADNGGVYLLRSSDAAPEKLSTPGYAALIEPVLTSDGHLLYAGDGLYLVDLLQADATPPLQIASIDKEKQVIASMAVSADGKEVFWSVEPHNGSGAISLYEATLTPAGATAPTLLYTQPANSCPCYMIFGLAQSGSSGTTTLLLTDNLGTPADQGTGLWTFDRNQQLVGSELLAEDQGQAPLAMSADHMLLAYAPTTGEVPEPTDSSVPTQVGSQPYGNSIAVMSANAGASGKPITLVPAQTNVHNFSSYHWITTPVFSPDNRSIAYIQFSSDDTGPYDRHSALY
ncbi:MAG TPA: hypothetical protein VFU69_05820, partial [Ktedonobacterales bacterium]|nr:hypothetical protein [Ktedonobacterales bacterium]